VTLVLDASAALAWVLDDERTTTIAPLFHAIVRTGAWVPVHWPLEVANAMTLAVRRGRMTQAGRARALAGFLELDIEIDDETTHHAWGATLALADLYGLTLYDAAYLELAQRRRLPLITFDAALARAAKAAGVEVGP
jgi:predicted nucleic acid-binding protein